MTDNLRVHHSFRSVASLQKFTVDALLKEVQRIKECYVPVLKGEAGLLEGLVKKDSTVGISLFDYETSRDPMSKKIYVDNHNAALILQDWKAKGLKTLELDVSRDLCEQVLEMAAENPAKCSPNLHIRPYKDSSGKVVGYSFPKNELQ